MATIDSLTLKATPLTTDTIELNDGQKATLGSLPLTTAGAADATSKVSTHAALTDAHGATASNTASRIVSRNADGSFTISGVQLDTSATPTSAVGFLRWNDTDKCAEIETLDGVVVQIGQESNIYARNESGSTLANGKAVVVDGSVGQRMTFILADSTSADARKTIGLVTSDSGISNNGFGFVTTFGLVRDLDTSAFVDGDELFLSTAGNYITTKPVAESSSVVRIGWVIRAHATQGSIFVAPHFHGTVVGDAVMNAASKAVARAAISADEQTKSANFTAVAGESYVITASATVTDPSSPVNGQSYRVRVSAGTATVGGVGYSTVGSVITRSHDGGAWANQVVSSADIAGKANLGGGNTFTGLQVLDGSIAISLAISGADSFLTITKDVFKTANTDDGSFSILDQGILTLNDGVNEQVITATTLDSKLDVNGNGSALTGITAAQVANTPAGTIAATTVQAAINELDSEKAKLTGGNIFSGSQLFLESSPVIQAASGPVFLQFQNDAGSWRIRFQTNPSNGWFEMASSVGVIQRRWSGMDDLFASSGRLMFSSESDFATAGVGAADCYIYRLSAGIIGVSGGISASNDIATDTIGKTVKIKSGSNAKAGSFTLVAGSATVSNTAVTSNSVILVTLKTLGGTRAGNPDIVPTASTGFVATGGGSDTSTYNYVILEVN